MLRYHEIKKLTLRQVVDHYFAPRDETGQVKEVIAEPVKRKHGGPQGLGLEKYQCWIVSEEEENDPNSISVSTIIARFYSMGIEVAKTGGFGAEAPAKDYPACKRYLDAMWKAWEEKHGHKPDELAELRNRENELWNKRLRFTNVQSN